jgi:hypothetical protein
LRLFAIAFRRAALDKYGRFVTSSIDGDKGEPQGAKAALWNACRRAAGLERNG